MTERWKEDNRRRGDEGRYRGQGEMGQAEDRYGHDYQSSGAEGRDAHEEERRYGRSERPSRAQERSGRYEGGAGGTDDRYYGRGEGANPQAGYRRQAGGRGGFAGSGMESGEEDTGGRGYGPGGYDQGGYGQGGYGQGGYGQGGYGQGGMGQGRMGQGWSGQEGQRGHAGRGPKGYTRSDDRIREDLNEQLTQDWHLDASEIEVEVANCEITLSGTVGSRDEKRRAEDIAEGVSGVKHVQNNLRVQHSSGQQGSGQLLGSGGSAGSGGSGKNARGGGL